MLSQTLCRTLPTFGLALLLLSPPAASAGQGAGRMLYTVPNSAFIQNPSGDSIVNVTDVSGSIATLQASINNARSANPNSILVIHLLKGAIYTVSTASLTLGSQECLLASSATIQAASSSVTVPLIQITSGSTNVSISGGTLNGAGASINGILATSAARVNVDKVIVQNCGLDCILLQGNGSTTFDNEMTVTRCDASGSPLHAGISIQNSTQTLVVDNNCHNNLVGIWLSNASYCTVANNTCEFNTTGIDINTGNENSVVNNTCNSNGTGILAAGSNTMFVSNALGANTTTGINSTGSGNHFIDNLFTSGNAANFTSGGSGNNVVAYKTALSASSQNYFYPPLTNDQHNTTIVNGLGRTDLTINSTTIDSVQSQYNSARSANPNNVIVLHLPGTYTVGASPLTLYSDTCILLGGTIQINSSTGASAAIIATNSAKYISISGGIIDGGGLTGNNGISISSCSMIQIDAVTLRNFGPDNPRVGGSDVIHFSGGSAPYIVTRCIINGGAARGVWSQLSGVRAVYSDNDVSNVNEDGVDCDSGTSGAVVKFNNCHNLVRYGVFFEQRDTYDVAIGNICNGDGRDLNCYNNAEPGSPTQYNTMAFNTCYTGNNCIRSGSTGTNTTTSHNFFFNNIGLNSTGDGIEGDPVGVQNYYSQTFLSGNSTAITTSGSEAFFNSPSFTNSQVQDSNSGLDMRVQSDSTSSGAAVVTGAADGLGSDGWKLIPVDSGYYKVLNADSGLALTVQGSSTSPGALMIQASYVSGGAADWQPRSAGNGLYNLVNRLSGLYLDVPGASLSPGTQLDQQNPNGAANQQFNLGALVSASSGTFALSASPQTQFVFSGASTNYTVTVTTNNTFSGSVTLGVSGLPANTTAAFVPPSLSGSGSSTLTVNTAGNTPPGSYTLTLTGTNGTNLASSSVVLAVGALANPGTLLWTGAASDQNWSTPLNWTNITVGGYGPPGPSNSVLFTNIDAVSTSALTFPGSGVVIGPNVNTLADTDFTIGSLTNLANAANTSQNFQNIGIASGSTLTVTNNLQVGGSTGFDFGANNITSLTISGAGATLAVSGGSFTVSSDSNSSGAHDAILDLSGLDTLTMNGTQIRLGIEGGSPAHHASGICYLAATNLITLTSAGYTTTGADGVSPFAGNPALYIGHNASAFGLGSQLYLGLTNALFFDYATLGRGDSNDLVAFNPSILGQGAAAFIRGTNGSSSRVGVYVVGDGSAGAQSNNAPSTNDFSGGSVDALINYLCVGRGREGNAGSVGSSGVLTFDTGTINANTIAVGFLYPSGSNSQAIGTINVNGSANLTVNGALTLSSAVPTTNTTTKGQGTLNINSGTVQAAGIVAGGGTSAVALTGGTLIITNAAGTPSAPLTTFNTAASALHFNLDGSSPVTNLNASTLTLLGVNSVSIDSVKNLSGLAVFPLMSYGTLTGSVAANLSLLPPPAGYRALLVDNSAQKRVDLKITPAPSTPPVIVTSGLSNSKLSFSGANGPLSWTYYVLSSTNISLPLSNWTRIATNSFDASGNFTFTNTISPTTPRQFYLLQLQ